MAQCETGKNRMKALLPPGLRSSTRRARSTGLPTMSASSPCPTATGSRSRSSPAAAPTVRAPSPRRRGRSTMASSRCSPGRSAARLQPAIGAPAHRRARKDRPLTGGRAGRALSEADCLADEAHRTARARRQDAGASPTSHHRARRARRDALLDGAGGANSKHGVTGASARRVSSSALPMAMTKPARGAPTCCCRSARRPGRTCWSGRCWRSNCSAPPRSLRTIPIIAKARAMLLAALILL